MRKITLFGYLAISLLASPVCADSSTQASADSIQAIGYSGAISILSGARVLTIPFAASINVGHSTQRNTALTTNPSQIIDYPLPISDKIFTAGPTPNKAMALNEKQP